MVASVEKGSGIKYDADKLNWALVDLSIVNEINELSVLVRHTYPPPDEDGFTPDALLDFKDQLYTLLEMRMYGAACAMVMHWCGVSWDDVVFVYTEGAKKYAPDNWKLLSPVSRFMSAALRHIKPGINEDDFGASHWAHFCWNMVALRWFERRGIVLEVAEEDKQGVFDGSV